MPLLFDRITIVEFDQNPLTKSHYSEKIVGLIYNFERNENSEMLSINTFAKNMHLHRQSFAFNPMLTWSSEVNIHDVVSNSVVAYVSKRSIESIDMVRYFRDVSFVRIVPEFGKLELFEDHLTLHIYR